MKRKIIKSPYLSSEAFVQLYYKIISFLNPSFSRGESTRQFIIFLNIISINLLTSAFAFSQCSEIYGLTSAGGESNFGLIFNTDENGNLNQIFNPFISEGGNPFSALCKADNGKLYGMTSEGGGLNYGGVLFEWDPATNSYTKLFNFYHTTGVTPYGSLIQGDNGKLYGMTYSGGINKGPDGQYFGVLFEWDILSKTYSKKVDFSYSETGICPKGSLVKATNGKFYGLTYKGGQYNKGVLFEWDPVSEIFTKKIDFNGTEKGAYPEGSLILAGNDKLYGMLNSGGANNCGVVFEWDPETNTYTKKIDFEGSETGSFPKGSLIQADNGKLYGMTSEGGSDNMGVLFELDPVTNTFIIKIDYKGTENGSYPAGSLIQCTNGKIYGVTTQGGTNNMGVLFEWDYVNNSFINKLNFNGSNGKNSNSALLQTTNSILYGITTKGGIYDEGILFEWDIAQDTLIKKYDFSAHRYGTTPTGSLVKATNGKLYGSTGYGGIYNDGVLFEWDPEALTFAKKIDFKSEDDGSYTKGTLLLADNGKLYGVNKFGGANNKGVLYEWDFDKNIFTKKIDFNGVNGANPNGSLLQTANGKIFGITENGGSSDLGVIFEWDMISNNIIKKYDFNETDGRSPLGSLIELDNGKLYGVASNLIFEFDPLTNIYMKKHNLPSYPIGPLLKAGNGKLYGTTYFGGLYDGGTLFEWDPVTNIVMKKIDFDYTDIEKGDTPNGLIQSGNGKIYGMTQSGGSYGYGILYEWDPITELFTKKIDFNGFDTGRIPWGGLTEYKLSSTIKANACERYTSPSGKYIWISSGIYIDTIPSSEGCDSIITVKLKIGENTSNTIHATSCDSYTSPSSKIFTSTGVYKDTIPNAVGCDSIITIYLTIKNSSLSTINATVCNNYSSPGGKILTTSGIYTDTVSNSIGCDSIITVNLTVNYSSSNTISVNACNNYNSPGGKLWASSGTYNDTIPNTAGCDSVVTIELNISNVDPTVTLDNTEITSNDATAHHQWIDCDNNFIPITGETGQLFTPDNEGIYAVIVSNSGCVDTSECVSVELTGLSPDPSESGIMLYPNPTNGRFTIDLGRVFEIAAITITEVDGRLIQKKQVESAQQVEIDLESPAGIYLITISTSNENVVYRIIKN